MCPLCTSSNCTHFHTDKKREFLRCQTCKLVFILPAYLPSIREEKSEYDKHENEFNDTGYIVFLERALKCIPENVMPNERKEKSALDFGCGPSPVLAILLEELGYSSSFYDPFYFNHCKPLSQRYDLITCTEAIEHFHQPRNEWKQFMRLLAPGGVLVCMTKRVISAERFSHWHYKNDPTHVSFFSEDTFSYLALKSNLSVSFPLPDVAVFRKY